MLVFPSQEKVFKIYLLLCYDNALLTPISDSMTAVVTTDSSYFNNIFQLREHKLNNLIWNTQAKRETKAT